VYVPVTKKGLRTSIFGLSFIASLLTRRSTTHSTAQLVVIGHRLASVAGACDV
jgi:hypothetical protein